MNVKEITQGTWQLDGNGIFQKENSNNIASVGTIMPVEEWKANALLIAEAGTVSNECGLSPRELLEQRNELLEALKYLYDNSIPLDNNLTRVDRHALIAAIKRATKE